MPEGERIESVQVSELRKRYKFFLSEGKPLILRKNSYAVGVLLCLAAPGTAGSPRKRKTGSWLRVELADVLQQIGIR